jgi:hypothetical protein
VWVGKLTHDNTPITNLDSTTYLGSFDYPILTDMDEIRYPDWIECKLAIGQFRSDITFLRQVG